MPPKQPKIYKAVPPNDQHLEQLRYRIYKKKRKLAIRQERLQRKEERKLRREARARKRAAKANQNITGVIEQNDVQTKADINLAPERQPAQTPNEESSAKTVTITTDSSADKPDSLSQIVVNEASSSDKNTQIHVKGIESNQTDGALKDPLDIELEDIAGKVQTIQDKLEALGEKKHDLFIRFKKLMMERKNENSERQHTSTLVSGDGHGRQIEGEGQNNIPVYGGSLTSSPSRLLDEPTEPRSDSAGSTPPYYQPNKKDYAAAETDYFRRPYQLVQRPSFRPPPGLSHQRFSDHSRSVSPIENYRSSNYRISPNFDSRQPPNSSASAAPGPPPPGRGSYFRGGYRGSRGGNPYGRGYGYRPSWAGVSVFFVNLKQFVFSILTLH
ncbi:hypothetical protein BKA69DRAFT_901287 [Paraphysoderma sedebokerense]|nr:hypothetical protein BKA69DRAFT_901287 [Paraphysoderma sedebokerense]